ncbi:Dehydrogenase/reductase SDR family member 7C-A [Bagarius yarrelli]|uniref:Dehydrogenase/reductase SDR family member 7C-A n=1 Tax=Bagarius yarrelli TaxID=175774 RepID=A0A556TIP5_BAGYA|nr:Dehydrogenase/reductase SDR family member 7C-A [Bagarius yarrelli]
MAVPSVMILPLLVVVFAGIYYIYNEVIHFMSKSIVRNKVVLVLCGPNWDKLESLQESLCSCSDPSKTFPPKLVLLDFSDIDNIEDVITEISECYGYVDVLISNGSMKIKAPVQNVSLDMDKVIMDVNYFGPITLAKGILPLMMARRTGHFVIVNSIQGRLAVPFRTAYAASKHAVQAFFDCLRAEVEECGISVTTINHTFINGATQEATPSQAQPTNALWAYILSKITTHGVSPKALACETVRVVNWKRREVLLAHPIPWAALYIRSLMPSFFFSVVAAGVKDAVLNQQLK